MQTQTDPHLLSTALTEALGGATAGIIADGTLYAIDSAKVRSQTTPMVSSGKSNGMILFRGLVPTVLLGSVPVFGVFFLLYAPMRDTLIYQDCREGLPIASAICAVPATIVGVPADVLKKRLVLGIDNTTTSAIRNVLKEHGGARGLFAGWHVNLMKDIPFAGVKIGLYEWLAHRYKQYFELETLTSTGAAVSGVASGVGCAILTAPLDVVNTRIKSSSGRSSMIHVASSIIQREGIRAMFRGVLLRSFVLGTGSMLFWPVQNGVVHALGGGGGSSIRDMWMEISHP